jgi:hypothetical protein
MYFILFIIYYFYNTLVKLSRHRFAMQPLQNLPLCSSTELTTKSGFFGKKQFLHLKNQQFLLAAGQDVP